MMIIGEETKIKKETGRRRGKERDNARGKKRNRVLLN